MGEGEEGLVATAVGPEETRIPEGTDGLGKFQDRREVGDVGGCGLVSLSVRHPVEEGRRRQLLVVTGRDEGLAPIDAVDGIAWGDLGCLVEDHDVERHVRRQVLTDRKWGHHEARLDGEGRVAAAFDELTNG